jgi:signal recognition particle receptor subunit beta
MRIGEIAIVGPGLETKKKFIKAICEEIVIETENLIFGRLQINSQLVIHLYGLNWPEKQLHAWDLVSQKLLGYIVLFNWNHADSYSSVRSIVDNLTARYTSPVIIAATLQNGQVPVSEEFLNAGFCLTQQSQFTFCKLSDPESARNVLIKLINSVIEHLN